jgi:hypothetical protein
MFSDVLIFPFHSRSADGALVRSYNRSFNAFAARLSHAEVERISGKFFKSFFINFLVELIFF